MKQHPGAAQLSLPLDYFVLVFALAVPFWVFGGKPLPLPINLPVSALTAFVPALAAAIASYRHSGSSGVKELLKRAWDFERIKNRIWLLPALLLAPLIYFASYLIMRVTGMPLPATVNIPLLMVPVFFVMFLIGGAGEELGWSGYAIDPMQARWGAVKAGLILGVIWAVWHAMPFVQTRNPAGWIVAQSIRTVAQRMVLVWIYNKTGKSVFGANLYHAADNLSWTFFPNWSSHYNPLVTGALTWLVVLIAVLRLGRRAAK